MFIVTFEDGKQLTEGTDVQCWDDVPSDRPIVSILLTAGGQLDRLITGYQWYSVHYETTAILKGVVCAGIVEFEPAPYQQDAIVGQLVIGVRDYSRWFGMATGMANQLERGLKDASKAKGIQDVVKRALWMEANALKKRASETITHIGNYEVAIHRLGFSVDHISRQKFKKSFNMKCMRPGVADDAIVPIDSKVRDMLVPK
jgi:hypothetical protein